MTPRSLNTILIINTVLCVLALPVTLGTLVMTTMGGASAYGHEFLGTAIVYFGFLAPVMPLVSIAGSWATKWKWPRVALAFVALPWAYALFMVALIGALFAQA